MTRLSAYLLPTEKQAPADAEALSHKLMVRAGLPVSISGGRSARDRRAAHNSVATA